MITYIKGDLFAENHPLIAHGCNCQGVMGAGIAKIVKEKWPHVFDIYKVACNKVACNEASYRRGAASLLGTCQFLRVAGDNFIANCFTQFNYGKGKQVSYDALDSCMENIAGYLCEGEYVAMPKIGAGLGGGEWSIIEAIINYRLKDQDVRIYEL